MICLVTCIMYEDPFLWKPLLEKDMLAWLTNAIGQRDFLGQFFNSLEFSNSYFTISSSHIKNLLAESPLKNWSGAQETFSGNTSIQFSCLNKSRLAHSVIYKCLSKGPPPLSHSHAFQGSVCWRKPLKGLKGWGDQGLPPRSFKVLVLYSGRISL